jgi:hypothetical protein
MALTTILAGNTVPLILQAGETLVITLATNSSGNAEVPGQSVSTSMTAGGAYSFGPYAVQREVVVTLTSGTATADFSGDASGGLTSSEVAWVKSSASGDIAIHGAFNLKRSNTRKFAAAYADSRNGGAPCKVLIGGDSTTAGATCGTSLTYANARVNTYPSKLSTSLSSIGIAARNDGFFGDQYVTGVTYPVYDPTVTIGAGWAVANFNGDTLGGQMIVGSNGGAGQLVFSPPQAWDRAVISYVRTNTGASNVNVYVGGALNSSFNGANSNALINVTVAAASLSVQTLALGGVVSGANGVPIAGVYFYNSADPGIVFMQMGMHGKTMSYLADFYGSNFPWNNANAIDTHQPHLTVINMSINDSNGGTALTTYSQKLEIAVNRALLYGDVILCVGAPSSTTQATDGTLDKYIAVLKASAIAHDIPLISIKDLFGSYAASSSLYGDALHPKRTGQHLIGDWLRNIFMSAI